MSTTWLIASSEIRRRRRDLLLLSVLVAVASGAVMAGVVASVRARTSVDRFVEWSQMSEFGVPGGTEEETRRVLTVLGDRPEVEALAVVSTLTLVVGEGEAFVDTQDVHISVNDPIGGGLVTHASGVELDRPILLEGRMPSPDQVGEIVVYEWKAELTGWEVGDTFRARTLALADIDALYSDMFPGLNGPEVELEVVGIARSAQGVSGVYERDSVGGLGSSRLVEQTRDEALWWPPSVEVHLADLQLTFAELLSDPELRALFADNATFGGTFVGGAADVRGAALGSARTAAESMANGLLVFVAGAALAGVVTIGQSIVRHLGGGRDDRQTLRAIGLSRSRTALATTVPVLLASLAGVAVGGAGAIAASRLLPTGIAQLIEVDPGVWIRPELLFLVALGTMAYVGGLCFLLTQREVTRASAGRHTRQRRAPAPLRQPPAVASGIRMVVDRRGEARTLPIRTGSFGLALAIASLTAGVVLASSVEELRRAPERWGWAWSTNPTVLAAEPTEEMLEPIVDDERMAGVGLSLANGVIVNGSPTTAFAMNVLSGEVDFTIAEGRAPVAAGEVALGARTLRRTDASLGDVVELVGLDAERTRTATVVGVAVVPYDTSGTFDDGVVVLPETLFELTDESTARYDLLLTYGPGVDVAGLEQELTDLGLHFDAFTRPLVPGSVDNVSVARQIGLGLAVFFVVLGVVAVAHTFVATGRRRSGDLATLRALGFVRRQVQTVFLTQAALLGVIATLVGVPIGLLVARLVWRAVTDDLGAVVTSSVPWPTVGVVALGGVVAPVVISWWPGHQAARGAPADRLRAE